MKFLHTSDLHLGLSLCGQSLLDAQSDLPRLLEGAVRETQCGAVILAGDLFDSALANSEAISLYSRIATRLCLNSGVKVIVCAGNHDGAARLSSCAELLRECGLYVYGRLELPVRPLFIEDCLVYVLPWFSPEEVRPHFPGREIRGTQQAMEAVLDEIRSGWGEEGASKKRILAAHCLVMGGEISDSDTAARIGGASAVSASVFHGFDYAALGHLHKPQTVSGPEGTLIRYCGSPLPYSFSESGQEKSFSLYDSETGAFRTVSYPPPLTLIEKKGSYEELLSSAGSQPPQNESDASPLEYVKITVTDRFAGQEVYRRMQEAYPGLLQFAGRVPEQEETAGLTLEEVTRLSPEELAARFLEDQTGERLSPQQLDWFREAEEAASREPDVQ